MSSVETVKPEVARRNLHVGDLREDRNLVDPLSMKAIGKNIKEEHYVSASVFSSNIVATCHKQH